MELCAPCQLFAINAQSSGDITDCAHATSRMNSSSISGKIIKIQEFAIFIAIAQKLQIEFELQRFEFFTQLLLQNYKSPSQITVLKSDFHSPQSARRRSNRVRFLPGKLSKSSSVGCQTISNLRVKIRFVTKTSRKQ